MPYCSSRSSVKFQGHSEHKIIHVLYATSSFLHHFVAIGEFKMELQSGNAQCGSKLAIFCAMWPWNLTDMAPLLTYFKLCASLRSHWWIQTGVEVWNTQFGSKSTILSPVTLKFGRWPWKTIWNIFYATSNYVHHFVAICEFKLESWSGKAQIGAKFALTCLTLTFDLWPWPFAWTCL